MQPPKTPAPIPGPGRILLDTSVGDKGADGVEAANQLTLARRREPWVKLGRVQQNRRERVRVGRRCETGPGVGVLIC